MDKLTLSALAATLGLYQDPDVAERLAPQLAATGGIASAEPMQDHAYLGGGSVPTQEIPTWCVALTPSKGNVNALAAALRIGIPAVMGRIKHDRLLLDLRSVLPGQDMLLVDAFTAFAKPAATTAMPEALATI